MSEVTLESVEQAIDALRKLGEHDFEVYKTARLKEGMVKRIHALEAKKSNQQSVAQRQMDAYASDGHMTSLDEESTAYANKHVHEHAIDLNKTIISVWQSKVKDRS